MKKIRIAFGFYHDMLPINLSVIVLSFLLVWITHSNQIFGLLCFMLVSVLLFSLFAALWMQRQKIYYYRNLTISNSLLFLVAVLVVSAYLSLIAAVMFLSMRLFL